MARRSTSLHTLTGDTGFRGLRLPLFPAYRLLNRLNNARPHRDNDPALRIAPFRCDQPDEMLARSAPPDSPTRKLCNAFWMLLPWEAIEQELGAVHVLDIGCGTGRYYPRLCEWSGGRIASYVGADAAPQAEWDDLSARHDNVRFLEALERDVGGVIDDTRNFVITQSAIEHFAHDLEFFRQIAAHLRTRRDPVLQVHQFPAASGYDLFPIHGIRQYTPRTVSRITRLFSPFSRCTLYELGAAETAQVHKRYVPNGVDALFPRLRGRRTLGDRTSPEFVAECQAAWRADMAAPSYPPGFYALVIHSHARGNLPI